MSNELMKVPNSTIVFLVYAFFGAFILLLGYLKEQIIGHLFIILFCSVLYLLVKKEIYYDENCMIIKFKFNFFMEDKQFIWQEIQSLETDSQGTVYLNLANDYQYRFTCVGIDTGKLKEIIETKTKLNKRTNGST